MKYTALKKKECTHSIVHKDVNTFKNDRIYVIGKF